MTAPTRVRVLTPEQLDAAAASLVNTAGTLLGTAVSQKAGTSQGTATGVIAANASTLMGRDAAGRSQVATPAVAADIATKGYVDATVTGYVASSAKGVANGVASLNSGGQVPSGQLPSFVSSVNGSSGVVTVGGSSGVANEVVKLDSNGVGHAIGLHLTGTGDVSVTSTSSPLQIGAELTNLQVDTYQTLYDNNEMAARKWDSATQKWVASNFQITASSLNVSGTLNVTGTATLSAMGTSATSIATKSYVDGQFSDTGWRSIPYTNSFNNNGVFGQYRVRNGVCFISGAGSRSTAWAYGQAFALLPSDCRPGQTFLLTAYSPTPVGKVEVLTTGVLQIDWAGAANQNFTFSGSFPLG